MIVVVDYGAGNLRSVVNAVRRLGYRATVTDSPHVLADAKAVILPGVGAAGDAMKNLELRGLVAPLREYIVSGRPFFGVCIGMQLLFTGTEEGGGQRCLDVISGRVRRIPPEVKVPHIGWNQVRQKLSHPVFAGIPDGAHFYFVHGYYAEPEDKSVVAGETDYGIPFCSVAIRGNLVATQFHPEKSGELGLKVYDNFIRLALPGGSGAG